MLDQAAPAPSSHRVGQGFDSPQLALTGSSSKQKRLVSRLSASQQALLVRPTSGGPRQPIRQRQAQCRLTAEQARQLVAEYEGGASMKELAARWDMHRTTVA
jgi:hypothetical protein